MQAPFNPDQRRETVKTRQLWLSGRDDREPIKRARDTAQARSLDAAAPLFATAR